MFYINKQGSFIRSNRDLPCQNCAFIEMGEMACYTETCPDCGRVPPSRSKEIRKYKESCDILRGEVSTIVHDVVII